MLVKGCKPLGALALLASRVRLPRTACSVSLPASAATISAVLPALQVEEVYLKPLLAELAGQQQAQQQPGEEELAAEAGLRGEK